MYKLSYSKSSLKSLKRIPDGKRRLIMEKLEILKENPYKGNNNVKKLTGLDGYRLRVGDYRVIYRIEDKLLMIFVVEIDVRGSIYK